MQVDIFPSAVLSKHTFWRHCLEPITCSGDDPCGRWLFLLSAFLVGVVTWFQISDTLEQKSWTESVCYWTIVSSWDILFYYKILQVFNMMFQATYILESSLSPFCTDSLYRDKRILFFSNFCHSSEFVHLCSADILQFISFYKDDWKMTLPLGPVLKYSTHLGELTNKMEEFTSNSWSRKQ